MSNVNKPWFVSGFSTAAGVIAEYNPAQDNYGAQNRNYELIGYSVVGSSAAAVSTKPIKIWAGDSSNGPFTTHYVCAEPGTNQMGVSGLEGVRGGYFAIRSTIAHADGGLTANLWGG